MKVLHVIPYMHPRAGGPPAVVANLVRHTAALGCESRIVFTPLFSNGDADSLVQHVNRLAPAEMLSQGGFGLFGDKQAQATVSDMVPWSDIVHVHTLWNPLNRLAADACIRHRRPYVLMPHGMLDPVFPRRQTLAEAHLPGSGRAPAPAAGEADDLHRVGRAAACREPSVGPARRRRCRSGCRGASGRACRRRSGVCRRVSGRPQPPATALSWPPSREEGARPHSCGLARYPSRPPRRRLDHRRIGRRPNSSGRSRRRSSGSASATAS